MNGAFALSFPGGPFSRLSSLSPGLVSVEKNDVNLPAPGYRCFLASGMTAKRWYTALSCNFKGRERNKKNTRYDR